MRVLVTGATGFVGREIISELSQNEFELFQTARQQRDKLSNYYSADISDKKDFSKLEKIGKVDAVIHSAGLAHQFREIEKSKFEAVNVAGTKNVAHLAEKLQAKQFILISSTAVYGIKSSGESADKPSDINITENTECQPQTLYAESKLEAEREVIRICEKNKIALTILRLAPVLGEGSKGNAAYLVRAIDTRKFIWVGKGDNLKSLIYKTDVGRACYKVLTKKNGTTEIFNLAAEPVTMKEFVNEIAYQLDRKIPKFSIPPSLLQVISKINAKFLGINKLNKFNDTVEKWLSDDVYISRKIKDVYGFQPEFSIAEAVKRQVDQYKSDRMKPTKGK